VSAIELAESVADSLRQIQQHCVCSAPRALAEWRPHVGRMRPSGLLEDLRRIGVRPDSVQVLGGRLSFGLPTRVRVWLTFGLRPAGRRDEAWLKRGLPSS
jgi:hypothetical protein